MHRYSLTNRNCYLHQQSLKLGLQVSDFEFQGFGVGGWGFGGLEVWGLGFEGCGFGVSGFVFRVRGSRFGVKGTLGFSV